MVSAATSSSSTRRTSNFSELAATFLPFCLSSYFKFRPLSPVTHRRLILGANEGGKKGAVFAQTLEAGGKVMGGGGEFP